MPVEEVEIVSLPVPRCDSVAVDDAVKDGVSRELGDGDDVEDTLAVTDVVSEPDIDCDDDPVGDDENVGVVDGVPLDVDAWLIVREGLSDLLTVGVCDRV